jgi:hypothetical protein
MPDSGTDLGADLYGLYKMAKVNLPDVANEYAAAASQVAATDASGAFTRSSEFGGTYGSAYQPWLEVRDTIKRYLSDTNTNLQDTAQALLTAVDAYSASDNGAATELSRLKNENGLK